MIFNHNLVIIVIIYARIYFYIKSLSTNFTYRIMLFIEKFIIKIYLIPLKSTAALLKLKK